MTPRQLEDIREWAEWGDTAPSHMVLALLDHIDRLTAAPAGGGPTLRPIHNSGELMKRPSRAATALALTALTLTACSGVTAVPAASGGGSSVPAICLSALDAADDVIDASMDVAMAAADLIEEIAPALEAAMSWDADGLDPLIDATEIVADVSGRATGTVERVDYRGKADQCRAEAGK